tara:strand:+ start:1520 stop:3859 length:2340 start_codon:yes stop_codon:yes gene_type:complete
MERLFNNQIRPQAQPITSFIQPQQFRRANASQPSLLGNVSTIVQSQQQSQGSVAGFNQIEQLATALAPFSKQLTKGIDRGFKMYATSNIEAGYYEEAKNQAERARLQMQINQEKGAEEAAALQTQLSKMDPVGASLLREANPWKAIGRRRALAQLAAGQVSTVLDGDLANNAGELSGIQPGSPELGDRKMRLTQEVYKRFGLTGSELEANYYVTPEVNKQWDKYTQTQRKYYTEEINRTTIQATVAALNSKLDVDYRDGVVLDTGERVMPGDPRWADQVGLRLTKNIDDGLAMLGGEDKTKALEAIRQNLGLIAAEGQPAYEDAIGAIRLGRKGDNNRPLWRDANPYTLKDFTNKGLKLSNETYREEQTSIDQKLDSLWNEKVGGLAFGSPEYQAAAKEVEQAARDMGKGDVEGWLQDRLSEDREIAEANGGVNPITTEERFAFDETLQMLTPDDFRDPQKLNFVFAQARALARREPTPERAYKAWTDYRKRIEAKQKEAASLPANSRFDATISDQLKIDLQDPAIAALQGRVGWIPGTGITRPNAPTASEQEFARFESNVRQMITNESFDLINEWQNKNPNTLITPQDVRSLIRQAAKNVRRSELYQQAYNIATTGTKDGKPAAATQGQNQPAQNNQSPTGFQGNKPGEGPVERAQEPSITPAQAKEFKDTSLMNSQWIWSDLKEIAENESRPISPELQQLSNKAGVHPYRMLIDQLKFYPQMDPDGDITRWLEESLKQIKEGTTGAVPYGLNRDVAQGERAPGAWLTAMTLPVQLTA